MLDITFLGHAGFLLSDGSATVAIDPFLTDNPLAAMPASEVECDAIVVTHGHADHFADVEAIAKRTGATVYAPNEICEYMAEHGHEACEPGNPGGTIDAPWGFVAFTDAVHSSSFKGRYMGPACGVVVHMGGVTLYHMGDTALFSDMALVGEIHRPDVACVPVGDRFTMGPREGALAAQLVKARTAIPMHYKTWPVLVSDISEFAPEGVDVLAMNPGETTRFE